MWIYDHIDPNLCDHHKVSKIKALGFAEAMMFGAKFPPVHVSPSPSNDGRYLVQNGAHRTVAAKLSDKPLFIKMKEVHRAR